MTLAATASAPKGDDCAGLRKLGLAVRNGRLTPSNCDNATPAAMSAMSDEDYDAVQGKLRELAIPDTRMQAVLRGVLGPSEGSYTASMASTRSSASSKAKGSPTGSNPVEGRAPPDPSSSTHAAPLHRIFTAHGRTEGIASCEVSGERTTMLGARDRRAAETPDFLRRRRWPAADPDSDTAQVARYKEDHPQTSTTQQRRLCIYKECAANEQWHRSNVARYPQASMFAESTFTEAAISMQFPPTPIYHSQRGRHQRRCRRCHRPGATVAAGADRVYAQRRHTSR